MKRKHIIYLTSFLTIATVFGTNKLTTVSCSQINIFVGDSLYLLLKLSGNVLLGIGVWIIGYKISKKLNLNKGQLVSYFVMLSLVSTSNIVKKIWENNFSESRVIIESICSKSNDDGMEYQSNNLSAQEYNYLIAKSNWLPKCPLSANKIEISYYRDEFLGDYSLNVEMEMPIDKKLDSLNFPKWTKIDKNKYRFGGSQD